MSRVNFTGVNSTESFLDLANQTTEGWFWTSAVWFFFLIVLLSLLGFGFEAAILGASFLALIIAILLVYMGLVSMWTAGIFVGIILLMFLYIAFSRKD